MKEGNPEPAVLMRIHELKVWVLPILAGVPRNMRQTVGRWPQEQVNELQQLVVRARYSPGERAAALTRANDCVEMLRWHARELCELRMISRGAYGVWVERLQEIGAQLGGWRKLAQAARQAGSV